jgi:hypothetical protein
MYTFDILCYGHNFSKDREVSILLCDVMASECFRYDRQSDKIVRNSKDSPKILYEVDFPYHGGQTSSDTPSICFGVCVTTSESNPDYTKEVRSAKEEIYSQGYGKFVAAFKRFLLEEYHEHFCDCSLSTEEIDPIIAFLDSNEPCFYSVEASN